jgi:hypothetical protein
MEKGKCKSLSEEHLRSPKASRGSYLELELLIFVKRFEFHLVTQSLKVANFPSKSQNTSCLRWKKKHNKIKLYLFYTVLALNFDILAIFTIIHLFEMVWAGVELL